MRVGKSIIQNLSILISRHPSQLYLQFYRIYYLYVNHYFLLNLDSLMPTFIKLPKLFNNEMLSTVCASTSLLKIGKLICNYKLKFKISYNEKHKYLVNLHPFQRAKVAYLKASGYNRASSACAVKTKCV